MMFELKERIRLFLLWSKEHLKLFVVQLITSLVSFTIIYKYDLSIWLVGLISAPIIYLISELESSIKSNRLQLSIVTYLLTAIFTSYPMVQEIPIEKSLALSIMSVPSSYIFFKILDKKIIRKIK